MNQHLCISGKDMVKFAETHRLPLYIYEEVKIRDNYRMIMDAIPYHPKELHYPMMCNANSEILRIIFRLGAHIQTSNFYNIEKLLSIGWQMNQVSITTTNISNELMEYQLSYTKGALINFDSIEEIVRYGKLFQKISPKSICNKIGIRIFIQPTTVKNATNQPHLTKSRIGIKKEKFNAAKKLAEKYGLKIVGIHGYLASNVLELTPFQQLNSYLMECAKEFPDLEYINVGGG